MTLAQQGMKLPTPARPIAPQNRYEAGRRWQYGDRSWIWSYVTDARFDADSASRIEMVRKARYFEANNGLVQRLADVWEQYTVGATGLTIVPDTDNEAWGDAAAQWFDEWAVFPDLTSRQNWATLQSLIARTWFIDGEVFILLTRGDKPPYRPRLQLIEGHRVGTPPSRVSDEGRSIIDGVEIDAKGRPIFYHIQTGVDAENYTPIAAENVIHVFEPPRIGLTRGLTHLYAVMNPLHDLDDLQKLEMDAAKEAAMTKKVIKTKSGELPDGSEDFTEVPVSVDPSLGTPNPRSTFYKNSMGADTVVLFQGDEYEQFKSDRPTVAQQWYWDYLAEMVTTGSAGIPLILVYPDKAQGTVYRGALDMAAVNFRARSAVLASAFKQIWQYVIGTGSRFDPRIAQKPIDWTSLIVRPPRSVNVDVGRNSTAMLAELAAGTRTIPDCYAELGQDAKAQFRINSKFIKFIKKLAKQDGNEPHELTDLIDVPPPEPPPTPQKLLQDVGKPMPGKQG